MSVASHVYRLLEPKLKYTQAFCTPDDIAIARTCVSLSTGRSCRGVTIWRVGGTATRSWRCRQYIGCIGGWWSWGYPMGIPQSYGGSGASPAARMLVSEELSRGDIGLANMVAKMLWATSIMLAARRDDLMRELAPRMLSGEPWTTAVCITEPAGGANIEDPAFEFRTIHTLAREEGDEYVLNGHKIWPGPAGPAERFVSENLKGHLGYWVVATTGPDLGPEGVGIFYVPPPTPRA